MDVSQYKTSPPNHEQNNAEPKKQNRQALGSWYASNLNFGVREKLIAIFLFVKIVPLIILAYIAYIALWSLGTKTQEVAVVDSRIALTAMAVENIERITTDTAQKVAEFLYSRDADIGIVSKAIGHILTTPMESPFCQVEEFLAFFGNHKTRRIRQHEGWILGDDGMHWVQIAPYIPPTERRKRSNNPENDQEIDGVSFNYRPPFGYGDDLRRFKNVPLYDEIALIGLDGMQIAKYVPPGSTKKRFLFSEELLDVSDPANTFVKAEHYFEELRKLGKNDIYVSDVIGAYVPSRFIGLYTPDFIASRRIDAKIAELASQENPDTETTWKLRVLNAELKNVEDLFNSRQLGNRPIREEIDRRIGKNQIWPIKNKNLQEVSDELKTLGFPELAEEILNIPFSPETEAFAGAENPLGIPFEGIIRWAKPVVGENDEILGYVTFALNHAHLSAMIDHITPMMERYTELSNAHEGNYAFVWDYKCRSIVHPRHYSIVGYNPDTGKPETPWLESRLYNGMIEAGFDRADWQDYIATLQDYTPWAPAPDWLVRLAARKRADGDLVWTPAEIASFPLDFQSRQKRPALPLTQQGLVGLDGRYLNNAPQCTGWMDLTRDGGSGSFYILWSGLYKLTTAATIPYYTGQYSPEVQGNRRGFGFVAIGAGLDDFSLPAQNVGDILEIMVKENVDETTWYLTWTTAILSIAVIVIAFWMASYLSNKLQWLVDGITKFRQGHRDFRFVTEVDDEFGHLAHSFDEMANTIVYSVHTPLVITDLELSIIYANDQALTVMGSETLANIVGKSYKEKCIYGFGSMSCPITALHEKRKANVCYQKKSDTHLQGIANYLLDESGNKQGYIITSNDVTELSRKQIELELANQHKTRFLARMSHELRTPMNAVIGFNEIARTKIAGIQTAEDIQELNDYLTRLKSSSFDLLSLLNEILEVANLESGALTLSEKPISLRGMLEGVSEKTRRSCSIKQLQFTASVDEFTSPYFITDGLRLQQVLVNLLDNAVKYTPEKGSVDLIVKEKERHEGKALISFTVRDSGIGIIKDRIEEIFRPFEQVGESTVNYSDGCGLGLTIVRKILDIFGSRIEVKSEVGAGSEFSFELWLTETDSVRYSAADNSVADNTAKRRERRALVVDDVLINRMVLVNLLSDLGYTADEAADGQEAFEMFVKSPEHSYDIILMDIMMPLMDGWESAVAIRAANRADAKKIPIVTISANAYPEDVAKSLASGMNGHYAKPIQKNVLEEVVQKYCPDG